VRGTPLLDMTMQDLKRPVVKAIESHFLTARFVGRRMVDQGPDTPDVQEVWRVHARATGQTIEESEAAAGSEALLRRLPLVAEVAEVAAMMASDRASALTGTYVNATCGSRVDC
jgi:hypothetical protein